MTSPTPQHSTAPAAPGTAAELHIFKPGRHITMAGQALAFSEADLRATVAAYNPALHEAPLVVGHPQHDTPAYGWVQSLKFSEGEDGEPAGLYALPAQVNPDFADMVAGGAFKKISAKFYHPDAPSNPAPGTYYLKHVGFLGAQPPSVKGLRSAAFAEAEEAGTVEFAEWDAPAVLPITPPAAPPAQDPPPNPNPNPQESAVTEAEAAQLREQNIALAAQLAAARTQAAQTRAAGVHADNLAFAEALVSQARLLPTARDTVVATLNHLALLETPVEFGEGEARAPLAEALRAALQAAPPHVEFAEQAQRERVAAANGDTNAATELAFSEGAQVDSSRMDLHRRATALAKDKGIPYFEAARQLANA